MVTWIYYSDNYHNNILKFSFMNTIFLNSRWQASFICLENNDPYYSWIDNRMRLKLYVNNRGSADCQYHSVINSSIIVSLLLIVSVSLKILIVPLFTKTSPCPFVLACFNALTLSALRLAHSFKTFLHSLRDYSVEGELYISLASKKGAASFLRILIFENVCTDVEKCSGIFNCVFLFI